MRTLLSCRTLLFPHGALSCSLHWTLAVICFPGEDFQKLPKIPRKSNKAWVRLCFLTQLFLTLLWLAPQESDLAATQASQSSTGGDADSDAEMEPAPESSAGADEDKTSVADATGSGSGSGGSSSGPRIPCILHFDSMFRGKQRMYKMLRE